MNVQVNKHVFSRNVKILALAHVASKQAVMFSITCQFAPVMKDTKAIHSLNANRLLWLKIHQLHAIHVTHRHVVQIRNALMVNVDVLLNTKEIHTKAAAQNVAQMLIVAVIRHAYEVNVSIHVLEHAAKVHCAKLSIICQFVHVPWVIQAIHSQIVASLK